MQLNRARHRLVATLASFAVVPGLVVVTASPAAAAPTLDPNWDDIEINEISSLNDDDEGNPGFGDAIELHNTGTESVSIEGWWQVDGGAATGAEALSLADLRVWDGDSLEPAPAMEIPAGGYVAFPSTKGLSGEGDAVKVYGPGDDAAARQLVDEQAYGDGDGGASDNYESDSLAFAACPDGSDEFWQVTLNSFGRANTEACGTKTRRLDSPVVLNEVSNVAGKIELLNTGNEPVDISGWELLDVDGAAVHVVPAATTLAAGAFYLAEGVTGLDSADALTIRRPSDQASIAAHTWFEDGHASYSRCELFGDISYVETPEATWGAVNACPSLETQPWPGASDVATVDAVDAFTDADANDEGDVSGVAFDPADPNVLWVAMNKGRLFKMHEDDGRYEPFPEWTGGLPLHFVGGAGEPDAEGVVIGPDGAAYVTSERDNTNKSLSYNKIARFDVSGVTAATTELVATHEWDVNDTVVTGTNLGLEGITWVPDSFLVDAGWEVDGAPYTESAQPTPGLFVTAVEGTGALHFFSLAAGADPVEVKVEASGFPWSMDVTYDPDRDALWALCDDSCGGVYNLLTVVDGSFAVEASYARPAGMDNLNNEGMAIAPAATCVAGVQTVLWTDDGDTDGHSLRRGTLPCPEAAAPTITGTDVEVRYGKATSMDVAVAVDGATPAGGAITLTSGTTTIGTAVLGTDGTTTVDIAARVLKPRTRPYPVTISYAGDGTIAAGTGNATLTVSKGKVRLTATVTPKRAEVRTTRARVVVEVINADGVPPTGTVKVTAPGIKAVTAKVRGGRATLRLGVFKETGRKRLTIAYAGSPLLLPARTSLVLRVVR